MPNIMCTRRLWHTIGGRGALPIRTPASHSGTRLRDWSAAEVTTAAGHVVVALEETTYLTAVCPLVRLPIFPRALAASVGTALEDLGIATDTAYLESLTIADRATFAKNDNRSLIGSVNDVAFHVQVWLEDVRPGDLDALRWVQRKLNDMPHVGREVPFPSRAVRLLYRLP